MQSSGAQFGDQGECTQNLFTAAALSAHRVLSRFVAALRAAWLVSASLFKISVTSHTYSRKLMSTCSAWPLTQCPNTQSGGSHMNRVTREISIDLRTPCAQDLLLHKGSKLIALACVRLCLRLRVFLHVLNSLPTCLHDLQTSSNTSSCDMAFIRTR